MKLHIGCGKRYLGSEWIHVDVYDGPHIDVQSDIRHLEKHFENDSVDEIYACHVFEHISRHDILSTLKGFYNILKPSGTLRLSVPDIEKAIALYNKGMPLYPTLYGQFWGGQRNQYDYHSCGFDFATISMFFTEAGFVNLERYDWRDFLPPGYDDYSRSYIPHMNFDGGELMSLNVVAIKPSSSSVSLPTSD
jgi:predicted SAM-dependent methyltransferase